MPDYYGDGDGTQPRPGPDTASGQGEKPVEKDESENQTALIPKALCAGHDLDVGDTVTLKIVGVHDAEYEVEYAGKEDTETESDGEEPAMPGPSRWDGMMD